MKPIENARSLKRTAMYLLQGLLWIWSAMFTAGYLRIALVYYYPLAEQYNPYHSDTFIIIGGLFLVAWLGIFIFLNQENPLFRMLFFVSFGLGSAFFLHLYSEGIARVQLAIYAGFVIFFAGVFIAWPKIYLKVQYRNTLRELRVLWQQRVLIRLWVRFNLEAKYTDSFLGSLWIVIEPLMMAGTYALAFATILKIQPLRESGVSFVAFFLAGITIWQVFNKGLTAGSNAIIFSQGLITQINIPLDTLIIVGTGLLFVDFVVGFVVMVILNAFLFDLNPFIEFLYIPYLLFIFLVIVTGFTFLFSSLSVFVRDLPQFIGSALRLLFYVTPVIYEPERLPPEVAILYLANPIAIIMDDFRNIILYGDTPKFDQILYSTIWAIVLFFGGYVFFKAKERKFIDIL